jgi:NitT/TauT family transport system ATP-binding protein
MNGGGTIATVAPAALPVAPGDTAIAIRDLAVRFDSVQALATTSLTIREGEFVSIIGPSGCGKTTILNTVAGLIPVQTGSVDVLGGSPGLGNPDVVYMLARDSLLPWRTSLGNAAYGMEVRGMPKADRLARSAAQLGRVGLAGFERRYPRALSHGMRQRVALARTFCVDSPIMLMDEPFGALDAQTKIQLEDVLLDLWTQERRTVMFVTHDLSEAVALSDRVIVMAARPGRIIAEVPIDLPRPRSVRALQQDRAYLELYAELWRHLENAFEPGVIL